MKIGIAQLNFKIGDLTSNANKIIEQAKQLNTKGADIIVFPELAVTGYYPWDLLDQPGFINQQLLELDRIALETQNLDSVLAIGCVTFNTQVGKPFRNSAILLQNGKVIAQAHKQLLPTYNIFDERRHFEPGSETLVIDIGGKKIAFLICEDVWNDHEDQYINNPIRQAMEKNADVIISLNASPWQTNKHLTRFDMFKEIAEKHAIPFVYVNQVGAHDEIAYDGSSFVISPANKFSWKADFAHEQTSIIHFDHGMNSEAQSKPWPINESEQQLSMITLGLQDYMQKCGFTKVVVGSSGGIDSAVTLALAKLALGADNVTAITMPSKYSSTGSVDDSITLCRNLGIPLYNLPIKNSFDVQYEGFLNCFNRAPSRLAIENTQARLRGLALMTYSNDTGALLLTTGNKSEVSVGYCTLYGDMNGGLNLIGDLYKTEVFTLAKKINEIYGTLIPVNIIEKAPSAELFEDQKDSDSLPPYELLDSILRLYLERDLLSETEIMSAWQIIKSSSTPQPLVEKIMAMVDKAEFKRWQSCPILRMHARAFGSGRRYPIAQGFKPTYEMLLQLKSRPQPAKV